MLWFPFSEKSCSLIYIFRKLKIELIFADLCIINYVSPTKNLAMFNSDLKNSAMI